MLPPWLLALLIRFGFQPNQPDLANFNPEPLEVLAGIFGILFILAGIGVVVVETIATRSPKNRNDS